MAENETLQQLSDQEKAFAEAYLIHLQKSKAAVEAGYTEENPRQMGYQVYNRPHVRAYITEKLKERTISAEETIKLISETARASITDYMVSVLVPNTPQIKVGLQIVIDDRKEYVSREMEFLDQVGYTDEEYDSFRARLKVTENEILRLEIELKRNPDAYRIIDGPTELVPDMKLDMVALVNDKEAGKVKKIKILKDGAMEVEMYDAEGARDKLMKLYGKYAPEKHALTDVDGNDLKNLPITFK